MPGGPPPSSSSDEALLRHHELGVLTGRVVAAHQAVQDVAAGLEVHGHRLLLAGAEHLALGDRRAGRGLRAGHRQRVHADGELVHRAARVGDGEGDLPALTIAVAGLMNISPSVMPTEPAGAAPGACAPAAAVGGIGAPAVCRMPAAPLTMSPK